MQIARIVVEFLRVEDAGFEAHDLRDLGVGGTVQPLCMAERGVNGLALLQDAPDQPLVGIATASDDGTAHVWFPYSTYQAPTIYRGHHGKVNAVASLPQIPYYGPSVASASEDQTVQIWSFRTYNANEASIVYKEHQAPVRAIASSPVMGDHRIVSGDVYGLVHLWTLDYSYQ